MRLWLVGLKDRMWARWTAPQRAKLLAAAYFEMGERLRAQGELLRERTERLELLELELRRGNEINGAPGLLAGEVERLALVADAAGLVASEAACVLREGYGQREGCPPGRVAMERALGRMRCVINLMYDAGDLRGNEMKAWKMKFRRVLAETTRYQRIEPENRG